jgi:hypothetical protein
LPTSFPSDRWRTELYSFDPNVVEIHIDNAACGQDITYQWRFTTEVRNPATFLQHRPCHVAGRSGSECSPVLPADTDRWMRRTGTVTVVGQAARATAQHRTTLDAELRRIGGA